MDKCEKCGYEHYDFERCLETYFFKHEIYGEDWQEIGAYSHEDVAERVAAMVNEDELETGEIIKKVAVANGDKSDIQYFSVEAELDWVYYSTEIPGDNQE